LSAVDQPIPTAERKPSVNDDPLVQVAGRVLKVVWRLASELPAPTAPRSRNLTVPVGGRTAIQ
jgi:hypothetical protein